MTPILVDMLVAYDYNAYRLGIKLGVQWTPGPTAPPHWLVVGPSGTGKTVFSASVAARAFVHHSAKVWIASYKDDDFFEGYHDADGARYYYFSAAVDGIRDFYTILQKRLNGDRDRSLRLLWVDELAAMVTGLEKKEAEFVKNAVASILQTGRSLNCQLLVSVQRADSTYFNNGARENFGNVVFLGSNITKEAAGMFGVDRAALPPVTGRAGYYIVNGNSEAIRPIQCPIINDDAKLKAALLKAIT